MASGECVQIAEIAPRFRRGRAVPRSVARLPHIEPTRSVGAPPLSLRRQRRADATLGLCGRFEIYSGKGSADMKAWPRDRAHRNTGEILLTIPDKLDAILVN